jgi:hypothetical protein
VNRKARVETRANVFSPHGKETTPTDKDKAMEESGREAEAGMAVSLEDEVGNVREKETAFSKKETDGMDVKVAKVDNEEDYNMMTANEEIEVEDNTKANTNKEGKRSIKELNKGLKSNIIYEWPEGTKFTRTLLAKKIPPLVWKKKKAFTTLELDKASTAGKSLMVAVAEYGDAWKENFQGEELNGVFRMDVGLEIMFRSRCACYTCNFAYGAIPRVRKILSKLLRIEMENYHIIMTMGMYRIEPPWILVCLIQTY